MLHFFGEHSYSHIWIINLVPLKQAMVPPWQILNKGVHLNYDD